MGALTERNVIVVFLATIFAASFFVACNPDETPIEPPATMTISGKVLDLIAQASPGTVPPIAGATLEVVSSDPDSECRCESAPLRGGLQRTRRKRLVPRRQAPPGYRLTPLKTHLRPVALRRCRGRNAFSDRMVGDQPAKRLAMRL